MLGHFTVHAILGIRPPIGTGWARLGVQDRMDQQDGLDGSRDGLGKDEGSRSFQRLKPWDLRQTLVWFMIPCGRNTDKAGDARCWASVKTDDDT